MDAQSEVKEFFEGFQLYQKIIEHNYMAHREIFQWMLPRLKEQKDGIKVLELGCGDAYITSKTADYISINQYVGIDLSEPALAYANSNLSKKITTVELRSGDMGKVIQDVEGTFDIIIGSYSIHHLLRLQKQELFRQIARLLDPAGRFYLIDIIKFNDEAREEYLDRANECFTNEWQELNEDQIKSIRDHVYTYDFPESFESYKYLGSQVDMKSLSSDYLDPKQLFGVMEMVKR